MVRVELVYVPEDGSPIRRHVVLSPGATVADALEQSHLRQDHPETNSLLFGIFSKPALLDTVVKEGDRIEIYRPLLLSPKENRRQRAKVRK